MLIITDDIRYYTFNKIIRTSKVFDYETVLSIKLVPWSERAFTLFPIIYCEKLILGSCILVRNFRFSRGEGINERHGDVTAYIMLKTYYCFLQNPQGPSVDRTRCQGQERREIRGAEPRAIKSRFRFSDSKLVKE